MIRYQDSHVYVAAQEDIRCPQCGSQSLKDEGPCSYGCCDDYACKDCGYGFRVERPD